MQIPHSIRKNSRQFIYGLLILLPSVMTGNIYSSIDQQQSTSVMLSGLTALSDSIYTQMTTSQDNLAYTSKLMLSHEEFLNFNASGMSQLLGEFTFYNPIIENVYVIDTNHTVIYGINNNNLNNIDYTTHIDSALSGIPSYYSSFINNKPFIQSTYPIFSIDSSAPPLGALIITFSLDSLEQRLQSLNSNSPNLNAYVFDAAGRIIASSSPSNSNSTRTIDIKRIRQGLDYDPATTFLLFDDQPLNGIYYTLEDSGWTLLVTSTPATGVQAADLVSWIAGLLGLGGISTSEAIRKKLQSTTPSPPTPEELPNIDPPSPS